MARVRRQLAAWAGALLATVTGAAPATAPAQEAAAGMSVVTITGRRPKTPAEISRAIATFVRAQSQPSYNDHLSRWAEPICPSVEGLPPGYSAFVAARIRTVATQVGAPVDPAANCDPNVRVAFTPHPQALLDDIAAHHSVLLGYHYVAATGRMKAFTRTIQAWYVTGTVSPSGGVRLDYAYGKSVDGTTIGSRLAGSISSVFKRVTIVGDATKLADQPIGPAADYIAYLSLARLWNLSACSPMPSILNRFADGCPADLVSDHLTDFDMAYLRALYGINTQGVLSQEQAQIASRVTRALRGDKPR